MKTFQWIESNEASRWQTKEIVLKPGTQSAALHLVVGNQERQNWEGFGGCFNELGWMALSGLEESDRAKILRELFHPKEGCRFNLCRLPIGANDYSATWYSHNETDGDYEMANFSISQDHRHLLPYIKSALALRSDLTLFASPWSPPTWMKFPKSYNYGRLVWNSRNLSAYALYFARFIEAYAQEEISIHQVHVQNEPNSDQKFPSCLWTGDEMRDFIRDHLGPLFRERGLATEIWAGTIERADYDAWAGRILSDPAARQFISGIGYQWAGQGAIQKTHAAWPNLRMLQTENECGDGTNTWSYALYVFGLIQHYLSNGANGYVYWNMVLESGGVSTWGWRQNSMITIDPSTSTATLNPEFFVMKHFSHFVEPGAVRLETSGSWTPNALAFRNPDNTLAVIVSNPHPTPQEFAIQAGGMTWSGTLPARSFHSFVEKQEG